MWLFERTRVLDDYRKQLEECESILSINNETRAKISKQLESAGDAMREFVKEHLAVVDREIIEVNKKIDTVKQYIATCEEIMAETRAWNREKNLELIGVPCAPKKYRTAMLALVNAFVAFWNFDISLNSIVEKPLHYGLFCMFVLRNSQHEAFELACSRGYSGVTAFLTDDQYEELRDFLKRDLMRVLLGQSSEEAPDDIQGLA